MMMSMLLAASLAGAPVLRLQLEVREYGLRGRGVMVVDRRNGRYMRRFDVGPAGASEGYDGRDVWTADAANNAYVQGNAGTRGEVLRWSRHHRAIRASRMPPASPRSRSYPSALRVERFRSW